MSRSYDWYGHTIEYMLHTLIMSSSSQWWYAYYIIGADTFTYFATFSVRRTVFVYICTSVIAVFDKAVIQSFLRHIILMFIVHCCDVWWFKDNFFVSQKSAIELFWQPSNRLSFSFSLQKWKKMPTNEPAIPATGTKAKHRFVHYKTAQRKCVSIAQNVVWYAQFKSLDCS